MKELVYFHLVTFSLELKQTRSFLLRASSNENEIITKLIQIFYKGVGTETTFNENEMKMEFTGIFCKIFNAGNPNKLHKSYF